MQLVPIVISVVAAFISAFSVWNSIRQVRQTQRTRLGQLIDEMSRANWEYDKELEANDLKIAENVVADFNARQEILALQAIGILPSFRGRVSSRELTVIAGVLEHIHDYSTANELYKKALKVAEKEGAPYVSRIHEDYGNFLFVTGKLSNGSHHLKLAADVLPPPEGDRALQRKFYAVGLRAVQHARHQYDLGVASELIAVAEDLLEKVETEDFREEMESDFKEYSEQVKKAYENKKMAPNRKRLGISRPAR